MVEKDMILKQKYDPLSPRLGMRAKASRLLGLLLVITGALMMVGGMWLVSDWTTYCVNCANKLWCSHFGEFYFCYPLNLRCVRFDRWYEPLDVATGLIMLASLLLASGGYLIGRRET